jgi:hypothetical protein
VCHWFKSSRRYQILIITQGAELMKQKIKKNNTKTKFTSAFKDLVVFVIIVILIFILSYFFDIFLFLVKFFQKNPGSLIYIDEIFTGLLVLAIGSAVFAWRRWAELKKETAERIKAQEDLIELAHTKAETERIINKQLHWEIEKRKELEREYRDKPPIR